MSRNYELLKPKEQGAFQRKQAAFQPRNSDHYREVWDGCSHISDNNNSRIESLKREAKREHQKMIGCFNQASSEYEYGDKSMALIYVKEGHEHKKRRDELDAEISELTREVKDTRKNAE